MTLLDWGAAKSSFYPLLLGLQVTVELTLVVIVISLIAAIPIALARRSRLWIIRYPVHAYVEIIRSTPLLLQLIYIYYVLPVIGIKLNPFFAGVAGLSIHYIAYISEVYRTGIEAVPDGQIQAARAIGMSKFQINRKVVLPQAVRMVIPALGNYFVSLFKDTALTSVISVNELLFRGQIIGARTYQYFTIFTVTFFLYLVVGYPATQLVHYLEHYFKPGRRKGPAGESADEGAESAD